MKRSLAVARLWLEVNTFSPVPTDLADFEAKEWFEGPDMLPAFAGTPTELGAVAAFAAENPDWDVQVLRCAAADPGGPMEDVLFDRFLADVKRGLAGRRWDAVYLSLHGALATPTRTTPDIDVVKTVRGIVGAIPLGASFDMHANMSPEMAGLVDVSAGYKQLPHLDMHEVAEKVLKLIVRLADGQIKPVGTVARPGCILHSFNMRTSDGPMKELEEFAAARTVPPILDITPYGGFPYADSPFTGASVMVYADGDAESAKRVAEEVSAEMKRLSPQFAVERPGAAAGLVEAREIAGGPVAVLESGDNTYSGGIADTTGLFRALLAFDPKEPAVFAYFHDPALVERASALGVGTTLECTLGGRVAPEFGAPVEVKAEILRLTEGTFINKGPMQRGVESKMGRAVLLRLSSTIEIVVTSKRLPVNDLGYFELLGVDVRRVKYLCVKAKNHFRGAFASLCTGIIEVDTPGPAGIDLASMPYKYANKSELV
jgi:microcystin degradation protein MlrC